jgi:hypothetical protein
MRTDAEDGFSGANVGNALIAVESRRTGSVNSYSLASAGGVDIGEGSLAVARDSGEAEAAIGDGALINSPSASVQVNAVSEPRVSADAQGFAGAVLASVGVSYAEADASTTTRALVGSGATITAGSLAVNALAQATDQVRPQRATR